MDKEFIDNIKNRVIMQIDPGRDTDENEITDIINNVIIRMKNSRIININERTFLVKAILNDIKKLDILQELLEDDSITEIMVNGFNNIFYERHGRIYKWEKCFESKEKLSDIVQRIAAQSNKQINESSPICDIRLEGGQRANAVLHPVALDGPVLTIRKFYDTPISIDKLIEMNSITEEAAEFLKMLVVSKYNIFISGGTGSGKTTFLNALSNFIPKDERIITIEDSAELRLNGVANLVRLEAREANIEGKNEVTIRDLIKTSLRMRPDRIIVGEVRGSETIDMLQAMITGHDGSMSTGHSNGPEDMILRLETMVLMGLDMPVAAIRNQIASAIDIIVHLGRLRDKSRKVLSISEVVGLSEGKVHINNLFEFDEEGEDENGKVMGSLKPTQNTLFRVGKQKAAGFYNKVHR